MGTITGSTNNSEWTFKIEWSESNASIANNTSKVTAKIYLGRARSQSYVGGNYSATIKINGVSENFSGNIPYPTYINAGAWYYLKEKAVTVTHSSDGSKTCNISATMSSNDFSPSYCSASGDVTLSTIPRYATVSQNLQSKTETTVTVDWTSDSTVDYIWYSTDNGTNWTGIDVVDGTSGSYTISGLTANTEYNIKTRVRRKDSQLKSDSSALAVTTYSYPYANVTPDFMIGTQLTIGIFNPLGRSVTVTLVSDYDSDIETVSTSGTSCTGFNSSATVNALYATIPNDHTGDYKVRVDYGETSSISVNGGEYSVDPSVCAPTITAVTYADSNNASIAITGDDQKIVRNHSMVLYGATGLSAKKSASLVSCSVAVNGNTYALTISGSGASGGNAVIDSGTDVVATFTLTDSRGLTGTKTITIDMVNWTAPTGIITVQRQDNFYSNTNLKCDAQYTNIGTNAITITYEANREDGGGSAVTGTLADNVTSVVSLDNNYAWNISITITDSFGGTATYIIHISRGMPIIYFDRIKSSVGVNCFPKNDLAFDINEVEYAMTPADYLLLATDLATAYSTTSPYNVGDFVEYSSNIYECNTACTAGSWNSNQSKFTLLGGA